MTDLQTLIARAEKALEGVTEGPWSDVYGEEEDNGYGYGKHIALYQDIRPVTDADLRFITAARTLVPDLVAALKQSDYQREELAVLLADMTKERDDLKTKLESLQIRFAKRGAEIAQVMGECNELAAKNEGLRDKLETAESDRDFEHARANTWDRACQATEAQLKTVAEARDRLVAELKTADLQCDCAIKNQEIERVRSDRLAAENAELMAKLAESEARATRYNEQLIDIEIRKRNKQGWRPR